MYDGKGKLTWEARLDIYGKVGTFAGSSLSDCPFRYQGQYHDAETDLYYNRFRYYDPDSANYVSQDPIELTSGEPNFYAYVHDPNSWIDIWGLRCSHAKKAQELGYVKINERSHGQPIYTNNKAPYELKYITPDVDAHNGGFWKAADSPKKLGVKKTRSGTYDMNLNRTGD
jgi:RHS repeat-associated protein